mgnify:CR=1 FL=1
MSVREFALLVRECRVKTKRWSQDELADRSGVSRGLIQKLEGKNPPRPQRATVIDLSSALGLDIDKMLRLTGHEPLTKADRDRLPPPVDWWAELARQWPRLPTAIQKQIVALCAAIVGPQAPAVVDPPPMTGGLDQAPEEVKPDTYEQELGKRLINDEPGEGGPA